MGDSWFAGVKTAVELRKKGLFFIGNVKTNHKKFPKEHLKDAVRDTARGTSYAMTAQIDGYRVGALGWNDHHLKTFVFTAGLTVDRLVVCGACVAVCLSVSACVRP